MQEKTYSIPQAIAQLLQEGHINAPHVTILEAEENISADMLGLSEHHPCVLIADESSLKAAMPFLAEGMLDAPSLETLIFSAPAKATKEENVALALRTISHAAPNALLVIGSGSLSDIGKYCAAQLGLPLTIIATAPSMNGYMSANASLLCDGVKQAFPAKLVDRLVIHEAVINQAPQRMLDAGKADALASMSADMDWQLSHMLLGTPYYPELFAAQQDLFEQVHQPMKLLELLLIQGLGMTAAHSSAPASGGEHMLAHLLELLRPDLCGDLLHGELISITHPIYWEHQQRVIHSPTAPKLRQLADTQSVPINAQKAEWLRENHVRIQDQLDACWPTIQPMLQARLASFDDTVSQLTVLELEYVNTKELEILTHALLPTAFISRDRFTMLDLE